MNIKINKNYRFTSDKDNFILEQGRIAGEKAKNTGETVWKQIGFYSTFDDLCRGLLRQEMLSCDAETIEQLSAVTHRVQKDIQAIRQALTLKEI